MSRRRYKFNPEDDTVNDWNPSTSKSLISKEEFLQIRSIRAYSKLAFPSSPNDFSLKIKKNETGKYLVRVHRIAFIRDIKYTLSEKQFSRLAEKLYDSSFLEWKRDDYEPLMLDGWEWGISVKLESGRTITKKGANRIPEDYDKVLDIIGLWMPRAKFPSLSEVLKIEKNTEYRDQWQRIAQESDWLESTKDYAWKYIQDGMGDEEQEQRAEYCIDKYKRCYTNEYGRGEANFIATLYRVFPSRSHLMLENGWSGTPEMLSIHNRYEEEFKELSIEEQQRIREEVKIRISEMVERTWPRTAKILEESQFEHQDGNI